MFICVLVLEQPHSGARCPMRPPSVDETLEAVILATPDLEEKVCVWERETEGTHRYLNAYIHANTHTQLPTPCQPTVKPYASKLHEQYAYYDGVCV